MTGLASPPLHKAAPAAGTTPGTSQGPPRPRRTALLPTTALVLGAVYCLLPVAWVLVAATKSGADLFSTFTFLPGDGFTDNLADLGAYRDGIYWRWMGNSLLYAGLGAVLSTIVSALMRLRPRRLPLPRPRDLLQRDARRLSSCPRSSSPSRSTCSWPRPT